MQRHTAPFKKSVQASLMTLLLVLVLAVLAAPVQAQETEAATAAEDTAATEAPPPEPGQMADPNLDLDAILAKHRAARLPDQPVDSIVAQGQLVFMGLQLPLELTIARPRSARLEADMAGSPMILAFNGEDGWTVSPLQGIPNPEPLEEDAEEAVALFADFLWGLLEGSADTAALRGIETVGNNETYVLEFGGADEGEKPRILYLGGEDFLEHRLELDTVFMGTEQNIVAALGDYRDVEGLMVPHDIQLISGGAPLAQVILLSVKTNETVDPALFDLPPAPAPVAESEPPNQ